MIRFCDSAFDSPKSGHSLLGSSSNENHPTVAFTYFKDGATVCRTVEEFPATDIEISEGTSNCRIGHSFFRFNTIEYGSGFEIDIEASLGRGHRLSARFEWLLVEFDLLQWVRQTGNSGHRWNIVAPRADVTGKIEVFGARGDHLETHRFRGSGFHDRNTDERMFSEVVGTWHRGRVHFADSTAVFFHFKEAGRADPISRLMVIRDGVLRELEAEYIEQEFAWTKLGLQYPTRLRIIAKDNIRLRMKAGDVIESGSGCVRVLAEMTLTLRDGIPRKTVGIAEFISPSRRKHRWLDWLNERRK
jgi:hypothetical protein